MKLLRCLSKLRDVRFGSATGAGKAIRLGAAGALLTTLLSAHAPLRAQEIPSDFKITERVANNFKPIGGRVGSYFLYPEADVEEATIDNVLASHRNKQSDTIVTIKPALRVVGQGRNVAVRAVAYHSRELHRKLKSENASQYGIIARSQLGDSQHSNLQTQISAERLVDQRQSINDVREARSPVHRQRQAAEAKYTHAFNRVSLQSSIRSIRVDYADALDRNHNVIDQDFRDFAQLGAALEGRYDYPSGAFIVARGEFDRIRYDFSPGSLGFDPAVDRNRNSERVRVEAGAGLVFGNVLYADIRVGYLQRSFHRQPLPIPTSAGASFRVSGAWNPRPQTTIEFSANRDFAESSSRAILGYRVTGGSIRASHALRRWATVSIGTSIQNYRPIGAGRTRTEFALQSDAQYYLSRRYSLTAKLNYGSRDSNDQTVKYKAVRLAIGLRATL